MNKSSKFSPEARDRTVRIVQEHRGEYPSPWAVVESIAPKIGYPLIGHIIDVAVIAPQKVCEVHPCSTSVTTEAPGIQRLIKEQAGAMAGVVLQVQFDDLDQGAVCSNRRAWLRVFVKEHPSTRDVPEPNPHTCA